MCKQFTDLMNLIPNFLFYRNQLNPSKGDVLLEHLFCSAPDVEDIIGLKAFIQEGTIAVAKDKNFRGILSFHTNSVAQQILDDVYRFKVVEKEYEINQYVDLNSHRPFGKATNMSKIVVAYKSLGKTYEQASVEDSQVDTPVGKVLNLL